MAMRSPGVVSALACALLALACSSKDPGGGGTPDGGTGNNHTPSAVISGDSTVTQGQPLVLDGSGSTDPDEDVLTFDWDFGDGSRGGATKLAHLFVTPGTVTVRLRVSDGRGGTATAEKIVTVEDGPAAAGPVPTVAVVTDANGPLQGVAVEVVGFSGSQTTGADGLATVLTPRGVPVTLRFGKAGYAEQLRTITVPQTADSGYVEATLLPREEPLTLSDAAAGGTLTGKDGARVTFPPGALVDGTGAPVTGAVEVSMTPVNVASNVRAFPGKFQGFDSTGAEGALLSYGTVEVVLAQGGAPVQLAPGKQAALEIPMYTDLHVDGSPVAAGATVALWSLDPRSSAWIQEGQGTVVAAAGSPTGFALRGPVGHFTWWNADSWGPYYKPKPRCCIVTVPGLPCQDLTNTGYCWHYGTGPDQPSGGGLRAGRGEASLRAGQTAVTSRIPVTAAYDNTPGGGGKVLPMPANLDIAVTSSALNGTYRGTQIFRGGPDVTEDVEVQLTPIGGVDDETITLPWDEAYVMSAPGEVDRFRLTPGAGTGFEVRISQSGSTITGSVSVKRPGGAVAGTATFSPTPGVVTEASPLAGEYLIEVTGNNGLPGAYRIEVRELGDCSSVTSPTLPLTQIFSFNAGQVRCFDLPLGADEAFEAELEQTNNGTQYDLLLLGPGGSELARSTWVQGQGQLPLRLGIAQAGTYRLRVANVASGPGSLELSLSKPAAEVLAVPGTKTLSDLSGGSSKLYVVKPPAGGLYGLTLTCTGNSQIGAFSWPLHGTFLVGCGSTAATGGQAERAPAGVLPLVEVFRNQGPSSATITVTTLVPSTLAFDTDVTGTLSTPYRMYALDGVQGNEVAWKLLQPAAATSTIAASMFAPDGSLLPQGSGSIVRTFSVTGVHTVFLEALTGSNGPYTLRVNTVPAVAPLTLTNPVTQTSFTLPIGQQLRYAFSLTKGELFGLRIDTPGALGLSAVVDGVNDGFVETSSSGTSGPKRAISRPRWVKTTGPTVLRNYSGSSITETGTGAATVSVIRPVPVTSSVDGVNSGSLAAGEWASFRYDVAQGRYLVRIVNTGATSGVYGSTIVWASDSIFGNYGGELSIAPTGSTPGEQPGALAAGSYLISVDNTPATATLDFSLAVISLEPPVPLTLGAGATAGVIDVVGERDYFSFSGTGGQSYTVRVNAAFAGELRVSRILPNGDYTSRQDPPFGAYGITGFPTTFSSGVEKVASFTIPTAAPFGNGTYIVEVAGVSGTTGSYGVRVTNP